MEKRGVVYLLWGDAARKRAERSIESVGFHHPDLPVCLLDAPKDATLFDKSTINDLTPFEETLYLDADTTVMGNLDYAFEKAAKFGMALRICEVPWARRWDAIEGDLIEYNTGVIFWTKKATPVFEAWKRSIGGERVFYDPFDRMLPGYVNDQPGFALAMHDSGFNPFVLPRNWNLRPTTDREFWGPIKIWHDWRDPPAIACQISDKQAHTKHITITYLSYKGKAEPCST